MCLTIVTTTNIVLCAGAVESPRERSEWCVLAGRRELFFGCVMWNTCGRSRSRADGHAPWSLLRTACLASSNHALGLGALLVSCIAFVRWLTSSISLAPTRFCIHRISATYCFHESWCHHRTNGTMGPCERCVRTVAPDGVSARAWRRPISFPLSGLPAAPCPLIRPFAAQSLVAQRDPHHHSSRREGRQRSPHRGGRRR